MINIAYSTPNMETQLLTVILASIMGQRATPSKEETVNPSPH